MSKKRRLSVKPIDRIEEDWLRDPEKWRQSYAPLKADIFTARLTVDITPELHKRIKLAAMRCDRSIALLLRELLEREYPRGNTSDHSVTDDGGPDFGDQLTAGPAL